MKSFSAIFFLLIFPLLSYGQRVIAPIEYNLEQAEDYKEKSHLRLTAAGDTLTLPFFDDFTQSNVTPDLQKWMPNGGTFINNNYPVNPPNYNVATFDGLRENGTPYSSTLLAVGPADHLTSKPIDLSGLVSGDSVYLRFYWQGRGLGEESDAVDSIRLQIKSQGTPQTWGTVWKKTGDSTAFNHEIIRIGNAAKYYYKGFQFRFQSFGRLSGAWDVWNVDYIYLDTGRLAQQNWYPDLSFAGKPTPFLKKYSAMPMEQYLANKAGETSDSIVARVVSLRNQVFRIATTNANGSKLTDIKNSQVIETTSDTTILIFSEEVVTPQSKYWRADSIITYKPDLSLFPTTNTPRVLKYNFVLSDTLDPKKDQYFVFTSGADSIPSRVDFTQNDTCSGITNLTDYYAYDDGTAEAGFAVNKSLARLATRYTLNALPDTITHVDIYFPQIGPSLNNESLTLTIWSSITPNTTNETVLYRQSILLKHSDAVNKFQRYTLTTPVIITSPVFYVGYRQNANKYIYTGFDKNTDRRSAVYYTVSNVWKQEQREAGCLMIRPVFQNAPPILGINDPRFDELDCHVFPNPTTGEISIAGKVSKVNLYDLSGRLVLTRNYDGQSEEIHKENISDLPNGFYIMHLENEGAKTVKKIVLSR